MIGPEIFLFEFSLTGLEVKQGATSPFASYSKRAFPFRIEKIQYVLCAHLKAVSYYGR